MTLYTTNCPKCVVLEKKLNNKNINYKKVEDIEKILEIANEQGINTAPILEIDGEYFDFSHANTYINNMVEGK